MNFLLVLDESERRAWGGMISRTIEHQEWTCTVVGSAEEALEYFRAPEPVRVDEVISGTFGGLKNQKWRAVEVVAKDAGVGAFTILTGDPDVGREIGLELRNQGIHFIDKSNFDGDQFLAERGIGNTDVETR